jgi:hypothetical protein
MRAAGIALALLCGCAKDFDQLAPFTCPHTGTCPSPYLCFNGQCQSSDAVNLATCPADFACPSPFVCIDDKCVQIPAGPGCDGDVGGRCTTWAFATGCNANPPACSGRCTVINTTVAISNQLDTVRPFCVPLRGTGGEGASCRIIYEEPPGFTGIHFPNADRDCGLGLICWNPGYDAQKPATCRPFSSGVSQCASGQGCLDAFPGSSDPNLGGVGLCVATCTVFGSDCPAGQICALAHDRVPSFGYCAPAGTIGEGQSCNAVAGLWMGEQCQAGLTCIRANQDTCKRLCRSSSDCSAGQTCAAAFPPGIGVCGL